MINCGGFCNRLGAKIMDNPNLYWGGYTDRHG